MGHQFNALNDAIIEYIIYSDCNWLLCWLTVRAIQCLRPSIAQTNWPILSIESILNLVSHSLLSVVPIHLIIVCYCLPSIVQYTSIVNMTFLSCFLKKTILVCKYTLHKNYGHRCKGVPNNLQIANASQIKVIGSTDWFFWAHICIWLLVEAKTIWTLNT